MRVQIRVKRGIKELAINCDKGAGEGHAVRFDLRER